MDFNITNRPKLPRNRYGWINFSGAGGSGKGGSGLDAKTMASLQDLISWFYWDQGVHCRFDLIGDQEVAAYNRGISSSTASEDESYSVTWIDSSYNFLYNLIQNSSGGGGTYIPDISVLQWNTAAGLAHSHDNKTILDGITNSSVDFWNIMAENLDNWFFFDNDTSSVVTPYNLRSL